ncbi:MAG TPA: hypothetical protein VIV11_28430 [Kofleriaceae bacterium]
MNRRREWLLAPLAYIVLVGLLYHTIWFPPDGKPPQYFGWDTPEAYWPDMAYFANSLSNGEAPLWNPYNRGGYAFYADLLPGVFYPVNWLFVAPGAVLDAMPPWTAQIKVLLHHVAGGLLLYVFLRRRKLPWAACFLGGAVFVLSIPMLIHKSSALIWGLVWAPLLWCAIDTLIDGARTRGWWCRAAGLGGALWLVGSAGMPQGSFMAVVLAFAYGCVRLTQHLLAAHRDHQLRVVAIAEARALAVAAAIAFALLAIVVLPSMHEAAASATRGATRGLGYVLTFRVPPKSMLGALVPGAGPIDMYGGLVVSVLAITAIVTVPLRDRGTPVLFAATALFGMLLAHGADGGVLPWLAKHAPGFALFREPNRYKLLATMSLAVVAAYGVAALLSDDPKTRRRARIAFAAAIAACGIALVAVHAATTRDPRYPGKALSLGVLGACAVVLVLLMRARRGWIALAAACALVAVQYVDITRIGARTLALREPPGTDREVTQHIAGLGDVSREWRIWDEFVMGRRAGSRVRVRDLRGYVASDPFDTVRYDELRTRLRTVPELLGAFNVRWVLWAPHPMRGFGDHILRQPPHVAAPARFRLLDGKRWEVVDPAPLVAWYGAVTIASDRKQALATLVEREKAVGQRNRAIIESVDRPRDLAGIDQVSVPPAAVPGRLLSYSQNRIQIAVEAPAPGIVVLNEVMARGWEVEVDGRAADPFRAELILRGVVVGPGEHVITWTYRPPGLTLLFVVWLLGFVALLAAGFAVWRARGAKVVP